jgi:hypothetical protein
MRKAAATPLDTAARSISAVCRTARSKRRAEFYSNPASALRRPSGEDNAFTPGYGADSALSKLGAPNKVETETGDGAVGRSDHAAAS